MNRPARGEKGFALVSAIFVLVVLAALGTVMVKVSGVQSRTGTLALQTAQAYQAARGALEWGIHRAVEAPNLCDATSTFPVDGFSVTVTCHAQTVSEGGANVPIYRLTALAEQGTFGSANYVSRSLQATASGEAP
ncbi:MAG: pilus assembly protein MshP [Desulfuromonadales bacterium]|nr:pilus assembly protein MshP [Desulfuromonadales bacterium]